MFRKKVKPAPVPTFKDPFEDPTSIGNVLLKLGKVTREQLLHVLGQKAQFDELLLGHLLKQYGYVCDLDIANALKVQADLRNGNPLKAELDVLQTQMDESARGAEELSTRIESARARRRERDEPSGLFLVPSPLFRAGN